jgi:hypothetical protein
MVLVPSLVVCFIFRNLTREHLVCGGHMTPAA